MSPRSAPPPGELGMAILEVLWRRGPSTAREVHGELSVRREIAQSTVLTVLRRLEEKGEARRRKVARSHVYEAAVDPRTLRRRGLAEVVGRFFRSPGDLALHLIEEERLSPDELARIEALVAERRKKRGRRR